VRGLPPPHFVFSRCPIPCVCMYVLARVGCIICLARSSSIHSSRRFLYIQQCAIIVPMPASEVVVFIKLSCATVVSVVFVS